MSDGLLLVNKPPGMTSHDVVEAIRRRLGLRRVGHAGTLDPMAQGLLLVLVGSATRRQQEFQLHEKVYDALLRLGTQTETGDAEGRAIRSASVPPLTESQVRDVLTSLVGPLSQTPPAFSAVKVRGKPAYWWARRQQPVLLRMRTVQVFELSLKRFDATTIAFRIRCSSGTYVRSLVELIAERLGTVGHLAHLTRLQVGEWLLEDAVPLAWLTDASAEAVAQRMIPLTRNDARVHRAA